MYALINTVNHFIWDYILIILLMGGGLYFTVITKFIQFRYFFHSFKLLFSSRQVTKNTDKDKVNISSFQAFCTGLAARVGTGNLAGVAIAISLGGPGAIFWMWMVALIGMSTAFIESTLGQVFKVRNADGSFRGGPAYYIERGLGQRWLGILFAVFLIFTYGFSFNAVQSNTISAALENTFSINPLHTGLFVAVLSGIVIFGGARRIFRFSEIIVPIMATAYILIAVYVIAVNIDQVPAALSLIVKSAFGIREAAAGGIAYMMGLAITNGVKRGLFSNEAGMGSVPNAAAAAVPIPNHPATQGFIQMLGVFFDTMIICTATAAIIILSGVLVSQEAVDGIVLTQFALIVHVGVWAKYFLAIVILFFAFTSVVANYYYAESNLKYIHPSPTLLFIMRLLVLAMVVFGAVSSMMFVWDLADLTMAFMAIINMISILLLSKIAIRALKDYETQEKSEIIPVFKSKQFPDILDKLPKDVW